MKEFFQYLINKTFLKNVAIAFGIFLIAFLLLKVYLRIYTHHGKAIAVPDLTDISIEEIEDILHDKKLRYEIFDSIYVGDKPSGVVIDQLPKPGKNVKRERKIFLTINAQGPETLPMPDLVGVTLREAREKLQQKGLATGNLIYRYHLTKNVILEQRLDGNIIEPGDTIVKGTAIDLVLGKGLGSERAMVPDLIGLTVEEARTKAADYYFNISSAVPDLSYDTEKDTLTPFIFRQRPAHDKKIRVPLGSPIDVWITVDSTKLPNYEPVDTSYVWNDLNDE